MFLNHGANPNAKGNNGQTPLHSLLEHSRNFPNGGLSLARLLLEHGADVNAQDKKSATPLHLASREGQFEIVRMLLGNGANPRATNNQGQTPLHLLSEGIYFNPQDVPDFVELFMKYGADVNARDSNNTTPLHVASCEGQLEVARMLLAHGANPKAINDQGQTPLHLLLEGIHNSQEVLDLVELLLKERSSRLRRYFSDTAQMSTLRTAHTFSLPPRENATIDGVSVPGFRLSKYVPDTDHASLVWYFVWFQFS
ncbi:ankyrin repeat-containing domain protein [Lactarius akahatsu]|uniref:Ankyrin repeat-containing domain protein n=1 Tax=Lactarius akahatsu TaxID=416441 RepID=A0AAD4QBJ6_9AGAM|nr:ankyrin repeat-containing domain protein [Lactarius akahatsu]